MIQIIPPAPPKRTVMGSFLSGIAQGIPGAVQQYRQSAKEAELMKKKAGAAKLAGLPEGAEYLPESVQAQLVKGMQPEKVSDKDVALTDWYKVRTKEMEDRQALFKKLENEGLYEPQGTENAGKSVGEERLNRPEDFDLTQEIMPKEGKKLPPKYSERAINLMARTDPQVADQWRRHNKEIDTERRHQEDLEREKEKESAKAKAKRQEFIHNETAKYDEKLTSAADAAETKNRALNRMLPNIHKLGWFDRFVSNVLGGTRWENLFKSSTAQEFDSNTLPLLEGLRQTLGGVLSDSDIRLIMQKIVTASKTPMANESIANALMLENDMAISRRRIGDEIKSRKENEGLRPADYEAEIRRRTNEEFAPRIEAMQNAIMSLDDDPDKLQQVARRKVHPGTPLNDDIIDMYLNMARGDAAKAKEMAEEDGYSIK